MAARSCAPAASAKGQVLSPALGVLRGAGPMGHRRSGAEARDPSGTHSPERVFAYFLRAEKVGRPQAEYLYPPATLLWYRGLRPL